MSRRLFASLGALAAISLFAPRALAEERSWNYLTTGNGHGFQIFDANRNRITQFLEHPYRFLRPTPGNPTAYGIGRRNLAFDVYFGVKGAGGAGWLGEPTSAGEPEQFEQTGIIRAPATVAGVSAESFFFAPFGIERNVMVGLVKAPGATDAYALLNFHMGFAGGDGTSPGAENETVRYVAAQKAIVETGPGGGAMVYVPVGDPAGIDCEDPYNRGKSGQTYGAQQGCTRTADDIAIGFQKTLGSDGWAGIVVGYIDDAGQADQLANEIATWIGGRAPEKILDDARAEWESWRKPPPDGVLCSEDEKKVWRLGEATLRMGQVREPNIPGRVNHGMILASLPIGEWHTGWVRDAAYAIVGLARAGHFEEAKKGLTFFMNAGPVGHYKDKVRNQDYRISVTRYFGNGEEESDWNQDGPNPQLDGWGLVLWASRVYAELANDTAWLNQYYDTINSGIAIPLEANLEPNGIVAADCSIWEVHDAKKKHFAYTTLAAARGFCDMAQMAKMAGRDGDVGKYQALEKKVREAFLAAFPDPQGALAGNLEELSTNQYIDAAVAEAFTWNILRDQKGTTAKATLDLLEKMRVQSGGYKRNDDGLSSYDNNEWILVDFRVAGAYRRYGDNAKADGIVAHVVQKAKANFYILPELYDATSAKIGAYTGAIPMVGYGGGAYIMTILDRAGIGEPNDCADGQGSVLPKLDCSNISTDPGGLEQGGPGADGAGGIGEDQIPFVNACLCRTGASYGPSPLAVVSMLLGPLVLYVRRRRT